MVKKMITVIICCVIVLNFLLLMGCSGHNKPIDNPEEKPAAAAEDLEHSGEDNDSDKGSYVISDSETADYLDYNYHDKVLYIAGLKVFDEFGTSNEGSVSIDTHENTLTFCMTKATGSVTGAVDGPTVEFKMDLNTYKIIDKEFQPAPNYAELGKTEFIEHSEEVIELTDDRMIEIGKYFKNLIGEIESN